MCSPGRVYREMKNNWWDILRFFTSSNGLAKVMFLVVSVCRSFYFIFITNDRLSFYIKSCAQIYQSPLLEFSSVEIF